MRDFWISWWLTEADGDFELYIPWWITGERMSDHAQSVCAAVHAESENAAKETILASYDRRPEVLEWRFCEERPNGWKPFGHWFQQAAWMQW